jgi:predicted protein tyrosine phosphatase
MSGGSFAVEESRTLTPYPITICSVDELPDHAARGVSHVLSILDPGMPDPDAFGSFGEHVRLDLRFEDVIDPYESRIVPTRESVAAILAFGRDIAADESAAHLLVHCQMGVSRSTAATLLLMAQARPDVPAEAILAEIRRIRPQAWPNLLMVELGDPMLGRDGSLVRATHEHYRLRAAECPGLRDQMALYGRLREVLALYPPAERAAFGDVGA